MNKEQIIFEIDKFINESDINRFKSSLDQLLKLVSDEEASKILAEIIYKNYTTFRADSLAKIMEISIRRQPNLAILKHPENYLFRAALLRGSSELYECYIEEAVQPFLSNAASEEHDEHYSELLDVAENLTEVFFEKYPKCKKGLDYNGAFSRHENNDGVLLVNVEDYELMEDVIEKYNTIIGRRDIIKDLMTKVGYN